MSLAEELAAKLNKLPRLGPSKPRMKNRLREIRESLGLTQEDVGEALGIRNGQISKWERGEGISLFTAFEFARFYDLKVEEIWSVEDVPS